MKTFAITDKITGLVEGVVSPARDDILVDGQSCPFNTNALYREVPEDLWQTFDMNTYWWNGDMWRVRPRAPSKHHEWNVEQVIWEINSESLWTEIRKLRNTYLTQSDWTQIKDAPLTEEQKAEWFTYRQALRDIPANNPNVEYVADVNWPTPPTT